ncbi:MAG: GGDEF domain-containing protein [Phycisphaerales bacterium]|nr:GGDEF domain-containing protein [Phycisphaerales bacterium]
MLIDPLLANPKDRLLVVCDPEDIGGFARKRYPQWDVLVSPTYIQGIAALNGRSARGLLVGIDPNHRKLAQAVAGLRKAAGPDTPLIICCPPNDEPSAREALSSGADDYIICPPDGLELDQSLRTSLEASYAQDTSETPRLPSWEELSELTSALANLGNGRKPMLERFCQMIARSIRAPQVRLIVPPDQAGVGNSDFEPALAEPITALGKTYGQILVGPRQRAPFSSLETERLRHYGRLIAHVLEAAEQQQQWQTLAYIDEITRLPNRRYLTRAIEQILQQAGRERLNVTVLIFDMDGFKHFNDEYGHAAGDEVLRETSQLIRSLCRQQDVVARYAGDEFVVVFWDQQGPRVAGSSHPTDVLGVLRRFKKALETHEFAKLGPEACGHVTISGGLATFPWDGKNGDELLEKADRAMLQAKRAGKNRIFLIGEEGGEAFDQEEAFQI